MKESQTKGHLVHQEIHFCCAQKARQTAKRELKNDRFHVTVDQKKVLENENFSERTLKIGLQRDQHFYRYNATEKNCHKRDKL